jgi:hypothetical protein
MIRTRVNRRGKDSRFSPDLSGLGNSVIIRAGPFAGIKGRLVKSSGRRMRIAMSSPDEPVQIEMDSSEVFAERPARRTTLRADNIRRRVRKSG